MRSRVRGREPQHDLGDADRRVVLDLAGIGNRAERHDAQRRRIAIARFARRGAGRRARRARRRRRSGSTRRRTRRRARTASDPRRAADQHRRPSRRAPASATTTTARGARTRRRTTPRRRATAPSSRACVHARSRGDASCRRRGARSRPGSNRTRCRARTGRPMLDRAWRLALAVTIGSRCATRQMPVPSRIFSVVAAASASATIGSSVRLYSSGSSASPVGGGVRRLSGMCVCSGM